MKNTNQVTGKEAWSLKRPAKDVSVKSGSPLGLEISLSCFSHLDSHNSPPLHLCQRKSNSFAKNLFLPKARMPSESARRVWLWLHPPLTSLFSLTARGRGGRLGQTPCARELRSQSCRAQMGTARSLQPPLERVPLALVLRHRPRS